MKNFSNFLTEDVENLSYIYFVTYNIPESNSNTETTLYVGIKTKGGVDGRPENFWAGLRFENNRHIFLPGSKWVDILFESKNSNLSYEQVKNMRIDDIELQDFSTNNKEVYMSSSTSDHPASLNNAFVTGISNLNKIHLHPRILTKETIRTGKLEPKFTLKKNSKNFNFIFLNEKDFPKAKKNYIPISVQDYSYRVQVAQDIQKFNQIIDTLREKKIKVDGKEEDSQTYNKIIAKNNEGKKIDYVEKANKQIESSDVVQQIEKIFLTIKAFHEGSNELGKDGKGVEVKPPPDAQKYLDNVNLFTKYIQDTLKKRQPHGAWESILTGEIGEYLKKHPEEKEKQGGQHISTSTIAYSDFFLDEILPKEFKKSNKNYRLQLIKKLQGREKEDSYFPQAISFNLPDDYEEDPDDDEIPDEKLDKFKVRGVSKNEILIDSNIVDKRIIGKTIKFSVAGERVLRNIIDLKDSNKIIIDEGDGEEIAKGSTFTIHHPKQEEYKSFYDRKELLNFIQSKKYFDFINNEKNIESHPKIQAASFFTLIHPSNKNHLSRIEKRNDGKFYLGASAGSFTDTEIQFTTTGEPYAVNDDGDISQFTMERNVGIKEKTKDGYRVVPAFYPEFQKVLFGSEEEKKEGREILMDQFFGVEFPALIKTGGTIDERLIRQKFIFGKDVSGNKIRNTILMKKSHSKYKKPYVEFVPQLRIMKRKNYSDSREAMGKYLYPMIRYKGKNENIPPREKEKITDDIINNKLKIYYKDNDSLKLVDNQILKREFPIELSGGFNNFVEKRSGEFPFYNEDGTLLGVRYGFESAYTMAEFLHDVFKFDIEKYEASGKQRILHHLRDNYFVKDDDAIAHGEEFYKLRDKHKKRVLDEGFIFERDLGFIKNKLRGFTSEKQKLSPQVIQQKKTNFTLANWKELSVDEFKQALDAYEKLTNNKSNRVGLEVLYQLLTGTLPIKPKVTFFDTGRGREKVLEGSNGPDQVANLLIKFLS